MKILVFADLHYFDGEERTFNTQRKLVDFAIPMLDRLIEEANREDVTLTVNLGDIIQDTWNKEKDIECLGYMFDYLKKFNSPCYSLLGNHDLKMFDSISEVEKIMGYETSRFSVDVEGFHLVFLTTDVIPELGIERGGSYKTQNLSAEGLKWLKNDLEKNKLPCFVFTHFPIVDCKEVTDPFAYMKNRDEVMEIINKDTNIKAVFSGHIHTPRVIEKNGINHYIVGSPTFSPKGNGIAIGVYRMIEIDGDEIKVTEHNIVL